MKAETVPFAIVPFLLLIIPVLEIATFIVVGQYIGVLPTLALILLTAVIGSLLLRMQGFGILSRIRQIMDRGGVPGRELVHGVMILIAGVLLLTPGFITDTIGFLLFVPAIRDLAWKHLSSRITVASFPGGARTRGDEMNASGPTIDLDADDYSDEPNDKSPWRSGRRDA